MPHFSSQFHLPVTSIARRDFAVLSADDTIGQAMEAIRQQGLGDRILYFYVQDQEGRLVGVLPTRRLLTAPLDQPLAAVMLTRLETLPADATVLQAHERLARHKLLALPVVDAEQRILGVVDVGMFIQEEPDITERERLQEIFETIGVRVSLLRGASPLKAFGLRFPWLLATIAGGTFCALLAGVFEQTLAKSLVLAFFLTLVLGLAESVSIQSMTVAIQTLRAMQPTWRWFLGALRREAGTAVLLGVACGSIVGCIVWGWRGAPLAALSIGGSIVGALFVACLFGLSVPVTLHTLRLDPKIAAGPLTLALTDVCTVLLYLGTATLLL